MYIMAGVPTTLALDACCACYMTMRAALIVEMLEFKALIQGFSEV
jgi:hypothetical protein